MRMTLRLSRAAAIAVGVSGAFCSFCLPMRAETAKGSRPPFELTIDSIMRGPKLVGYPPTGLRWSGDSTRLYFEWRRPDDDEASTWVVAREGGEPRKLSDAERRTAPPPNGVWDAAHRRVLFADEGDIAIVDSVANTRRNITRTTADESNPRWARHETAVTFTRDNNLFLVPLDASAADNAGEIVQLTDIGPRKRDDKDTDSQKFIKAETETLIQHTRVEAEKKKKADEKKKAHALPKLELQDRQSAQDLQLSPDGTHVFVLVVERTDAAKRAEVPNYVTGSGYVEPIAGRTMVGDAQDKRLLAVMNLDTGKTVWADGAFAGEIRWGTAIVSADGATVVASARATNNKDRWLVALDPESGKTRVVDALRDGGMHLYTVDAAAPGDAARQLTQGKWEIESAALAQDQKHFYLTTSEVHPGERHVYSMASDGGARTKLTSMTGGNAGVVSPDDSTIGLVFSYSNTPPEVYVMPNTAGASAREVATTATAA